MDDESEGKIRHNETDRTAGANILSALLGVSGILASYVSDGTPDYKGKKPCRKIHNYSDVGLELENKEIAAYCLRAQKVQAETEVCRF